MIKNFYKSHYPGRPFLYTFLPSSGAQKCHFLEKEERRNEEIWEIERIQKSMFRLPSYYNLEIEILSIILSGCITEIHLKSNISFDS